MTKHIAKAWHVAWRRPGETLRFLLLELVLRLIPLTPLLFLAARGPWRWPALLAVPLFFLVVPPARYNAAEVMQDAIRGESLFSTRLVAAPGYGRKIVRGLRMGLILLLWLSVFIAVTAWVLRIYFGKTVVGRTDSFTILQTIQNNLGGGDLPRGVVLAVLIYLGTLLPFAVGLAFHCGRRHELALGEGRVIRGHRGEVMCSWLCGALVFVPFLAAALLLSRSYLHAVKSNLADYLMGQASIPPYSDLLIKIAVCFAVLVLPLLPFRPLITACCVHSLWEGRE